MWIKLLRWFHTTEINFFIPQWQKCVIYLWFKNATLRYENKFCHIAKNYSRFVKINKKLLKSFLYIHKIDYGQWFDTLPVTKYSLTHFLVFCQVDEQKNKQQENVWHLTVKCFVTKHLFCSARLFFSQRKFFSFCNFFSVFTSFHRKWKI